MKDTIENFMTHSLHTIGRDRSLADAHQLMRQHRIRHLPVLEGGKLVGMVTQRDLALVESLGKFDLSKVTVDDAMSPDVFTVPLDTPVEVVAHKMAHDKIGSAVVQRGTKVVGIFTAIDALNALDFLLSNSAVKHVLHTGGATENTSTTL